MLRSVLVFIYFLFLLIEFSLCKDEFIYETKYFMEDIQKLSM